MALLLHLAKRFVQVRSELKVFRKNSALKYCWHIVCLIMSCQLPHQFFYFFLLSINFPSSKFSWQQFRFWLNGSLLQLFQIIFHFITKISIAYFTPVIVFLDLFFFQTDYLSRQNLSNNALSIFSFFLLSRFCFIFVCFLTRYLCMKLSVAQNSALPLCIFQFIFCAMNFVIFSTSLP